MKKAEQKEKLQLSEAAQQQLVVKSNELIQKTRFNLSLQEQKLILYIVSKIKPTDTDFEEYNIDVRDVCAIFGITDDTNNLDYLKKCLKALRDESFWIYFYERNVESLCSWINNVDIDYDNKKVSISLNNKLKPYLLQLKSNYTMYELSHTLTFKSKYSIRLYELLKSWSYKEQVEITLEQLRFMLNAEKLYPEFKEFKRNVLNIALREINANTDIYVDYEVIRKGRSVYALEFKIEKTVDEFNQEAHTKATLKKLRSLDLEGVDENE